MARRTRATKSSPNGQRPRQYVINGTEVTEESYGRYQKFCRSFLSKMTENVSTMRQDWLRRGRGMAGEGGDPRRNLSAECGYGDSDPGYEEYEDLIQNECIADRVVSAWAEETWQTYPNIYETDDETEETPFELGIKNIDTGLTTLGGEKNYYGGEHNSRLMEVLARADKMSGRGRYCIILIGLNDGLPLNKPVKGIKEINSMPTRARSAKTKDPNDGNYDPTANPVGAYNLSFNEAKQAKGRKVTYLRVYPESMARITRLETNQSSPRYGMPVEYMIDLQDVGSYGGEVPSYAAQSRSQAVHWTRVIHIADDIETSEVFGRPRLRVPYRRLRDSEKLYGGSAEMYWLGAFGGIAFEAMSDVGDLDIDTDVLSDEIELYMNGLQRYLRLMGVTAKSLAPQVSDPTAQLKVQLEAISIYLRMPMRIFMGSERGELASSQDDAAWNDRVKHRQMYYVVPRIIIPFVYHMIACGVVPEPGEDGFLVDWPDITSQTDEQRSTIAATRIKALQTAVAPGPVTDVMSPLDILVRELDYTPDEAEEILEAAQKAREEAKEMEKQEQEDAIARGLAPDPTAPLQPPPGKNGNSQVPPPGAKGGPPPTAQMDRAGKLGAIDQRLGGLLVKNECDDDWCLTHHGWFSECPRDEKGYCTSGGGGGAAPRAGAASGGQQGGGGLFGRIKGALGIGPKDAGNTEGQGSFEKPEDSKTVQAILKGEASASGKFTAVKTGEGQHELHYELASSKEDTALTSIMKELGKDGKPQLASKEEMDGLAKKGWIMSYRGVGDAKHAEQFKSGDEMYNGAGTYGNGTYVAYGSGEAGEAKAKATADFYAGNNNEGRGGATMRIAFPPGAKIGDHQTLKAERAKAQTQLSRDYAAGKIDKGHYEKMSEVHNDLGRYAALNNYDAIREPTNKFMVILNRKKCVVER